MEQEFRTSPEGRQTTPNLKQRILVIVVSLAEIESYFECFEFSTLHSSLPFPLLHHLPAHQDKMATSWFVLFRLHSPFTSVCTRGKSLWHTPQCPLESRWHCLHDHTGSCPRGWIKVSYPHTWLHKTCWQCNYATDTLLPTMSLTSLSPLFPTFGVHLTSVIFFLFRLVVLYLNTCASID